jgi:hypothetical protein
MLNTTSALVWYSHTGMQAFGDVDKVNVDCNTRFTS